MAGSRLASDVGERSAKRQRPNVIAVPANGPYGAGKYLAWLFFIYAIAVGISVYVIYLTPASKPRDAPSTEFAEERALDHVKALTDFGVRMAGMPELDQGAAYLMSEAQSLAQQAEQTRPDLLVQVSQEYYSGAVAMPFLNKEFVNMYNNITNVILVVSPRAGLREKSVLVNAHFDSAIGSPAVRSTCQSSQLCNSKMASCLFSLSQHRPLKTNITEILHGQISVPHDCSQLKCTYGGQLECSNVTSHHSGASDDASCVGIMLEIARLLIADESRTMAAPVIFLFNGAEESLCPASHAFMQQSPWAKDVGVFLNLESTGNQGPDFLFQQTGEWPMKTWVTAAPYPRGSVVAQDIFQLGILPADTDYRMFSANVQGSLPGIDIAFLLGAAAYHTTQDSYENIRRGTLQAMGENALAFVVQAGKDMALRNQKGITALDDQRMVFFDNLGMFMVTYSFKVAKLIHTAPLIIALSLPFLQAEHLIQRGNTVVADPSRPNIGLARLYAWVALETLLSLLSIVTTIVTAVIVGVYRVSLFGKPMSWHSEPVLAYMFLVPAAFGGALIPYLGRKINPKVAALGNVTALGLFSAITIQANLGVGFITTIWSIAGCLTLSDLSKGGRNLLKRATINAVFPLVLFMPNAISLSLYILQKANFLGAQGQPNFTPLIADGVAGAVIGLSFTCVLGTLPPYIAYASGKAGVRRLILGLFMFSALVASIVSFTGEPYSIASPKKVFVQNVHKMQPDGSLDSVFTVGAVDSISVVELLSKQRIHQSSSSYQTTENVYVDAPRLGWEWQIFYPFNEEQVSSVILQDDLQHSCNPCPKVNHVSLSEGPSNAKRLHLQLDLHKEGFLGTLNITGPILDWSLPKLQKTQGGSHSRLVRFIGKGAQEDWKLWVDIPQDASLSVRLAAAICRHDEHISELTESWPEWVFVGMARTYIEDYEFS